MPNQYVCPSPAPSSPSLVNKIPRYLNSFNWGSNSTQRKWSTFHQQRTDGVRKESADSHHSSFTLGCQSPQWGLRGKRFWGCQTRHSSPLYGEYGQSSNFGYTRMARSIINGSLCSLNSPQRVPLGDTAISLLQVNESHVEGHTPMTPARVKSWSTVPWPGLRFCITYTAVSVCDAYGWSPACAVDVVVHCMLIIFILFNL